MLNPPTPAPAELRRELDPLLDAPARAWLDEAIAAAGDGVPGWERQFTAARRRCGRAAARTARVLLLHAARADGSTAARLYERGTATERQAVLHALPYLPVPRQAAAELVEDALRANDTDLIAAAVGPCAAHALDAHAWRHAVLKCLFTGVPLTAVAGLDARARGDTELARMLADYARERTAAGRTVPPDLHRALDLAEAPVEPPAGTTDATTDAGTSAESGARIRTISARTGTGARPRSAPPEES